MHQTTIRFTDELWDALEREASRLEISVAQYLRDAALARLAYAAARRGVTDFPAVFAGEAQEPGEFPQAGDDKRDGQAAVTDSTAGPQARHPRGRARERRARPTGDQRG